MAAKAIQISSDAGATWISLPGSEGSFDVEAEGIDDTILGNIYSSQEVGLESWKVSSDGIYKGFAGYLAEIKRIGASTVMTDDAMTLVSGKTYRITNAVKEIWNRAVTLVIEDNAAPVAAADILNVDYLLGQVTFVASYTPTTPITVTGAYFPTAVAGCANSYNLTMTAETIDESCFNTVQVNNGTRTYRSGLKTVSLETTGIFDATENFKADLIARAEVIIEIDPAGDGSSIARGFFKLMTVGQSGAVGALEEETTNWQLQVPDVTNGNPASKYPFTWRHTGTTLSLAVQAVLTSWLDGLNTYEVRYLPTGAIGASPLDGIEGTFVVTDVSLSGGLSDMNVFQVELQGTDEYTEV